MARIGAGACRRFAEAFLRTMDPRAAAAAIGRAGDGALLLEKPEIREEIQRQKEACFQMLGPQDVLRRMAELAFGQPNDCVRLALGEAEDPGRLDLSLLSEVKRTDKGGVEVKLIDRLAVLSQLLDRVGGTDDAARAFFQAMEDGESP